MAGALRRLGLLVNPRAGRGREANLDAARRAVQALGPQAIATAPGDQGADALAGWAGELSIVEAGWAVGREQTLRLAPALAEAGVDALAVVGGDGTLADAALGLLDVPAAPPLLGIGAGTMNVGPLIACRAAQAAQLDPAELEPWTVDGLLAYCNDDLLGIGFNDTLIGFTVVATLGGRPRDLDAAERMHGRDVPAAPRRIATPETVVRRVPRGTAAPQVVAEAEAVGAVIVGFAEAAYVGKAVTGGPCLTALAGLPAGCLVADRPLARVELDAPDLLAWPPLVTRYASLDEDDRVVVEGVLAGAAVCVDGNPLRLLREGDRATFAIRRGAATALRPKER